MGKLRSQIAVALVCAILGFMIAYQFRMISIQNSKSSSQTDSTQVTAEITQLTNEKSELSKKINTLQDQLTKYQNSAADQSTANKQMLDELNNLNLLTGSVDVTGPGITLTITPKNTIFSSDISKQGDVITDIALINIVNTLNFAGAEAISINDIRVTSQTAIKTTAGITAIIIGKSDRISPYKTITIKAIGNKDKLNSALVFPGELSDIPISSYDVPSPVKSDNIRVNKSNNVLNFEYAKQANK